MDHTAQSFFVKFIAWIKELQILRWFGSKHEQNMPDIAPHVVIQPLPVSSVNSRTHNEKRLAELLNAVQSKFPGETAFDTALRYIQNAEKSNKPSRPTHN